MIPFITYLSSLNSDKMSSGQDQQQWRYGELQKTGFEWEQMIDNCWVPCHIGTILLTWECLEIETHPSALLPSERAGTVWYQHQLECKHVPWAIEVGLPLDRYFPSGESLYHHFKFWRLIHDAQQTQEDKACSGVVGPGSLWIEYVEGFSDPKDWYISEVLGAAYDSQYALSTLKYVFVDNVVDKETREFCLTQLFTARNGLSWPPPGNKVIVWRHGAAEFRALLGTPIGRVVASLVLAAYGQGVPRIASIAVFRTEFLIPYLNMRFDLEDNQK
jgi:hypothetical protein